MDPATPAAPPEAGPAEVSYSEAARTPPPKKRKGFRWGCFCCANFFTGVFIVILLLLFWPTIGKVGGRKVLPKAPNAIVANGARIEILEAEDLGHPGYTGPGADAWGVIHVTARIHNQDRIPHALDLAMFQIRDGYKLQYRPDPGQTSAWYSSNFKKIPWDQPLAAGKSQMVHALFVLQDPPKNRQLYVRRGFDWNSLNYVTIKMPMKAKKARFKAVVTDTTIEPELKDVGEVFRLEKKEDLR